MKAISLWQPWASAVAIGAKKIETRCWSTSYRGELAIHAAKKDTRQLRVFIASKACDPLRDAGLTRLPLGAIVAICNLVECVPTEYVRNISDQERALGNYSPGRFAWFFSQIRQLDPVPYRGYQRLFEWTRASTADELKALEMMTYQGSN